MTNDNGNSMVMPVAPAGYGGGFGGGFGGDWGWIILLLLCGWGGFGGGFGGYGGADIYPWMNQADITTSGFQNLQTNNAVSSLQNSVTSGFGDVQTALCGGFAGVTAAVNNGFAQTEIADNARQMANMQQMFGLQSQFSECCCENRLATANLASTIANDGAATRQSIANGIQSLKDQLCDYRNEQKDDIIAQLRSELMYARGQQSQDVQTAAIQAGQRGLANEIEQYVLPTPRPAYLVQNPNCCQNFGTFGGNSFMN